MSYNPPFKTNDKIENLCITIAEYVGMIDPKGSFSTDLRLHRDLRIRTIYSSLIIEGNGLSREAVTAIIDGKRVLGDARDIREVENAQRAYSELDELDPYNIDDLLRAHKVMMGGLSSEAGRLRSKNVGVYNNEQLIHAGTPSRYVPNVLKDLFQWLRSTTMHPLLSSCAFHFEFEYIHPFADGNGRIGHLWQTLLLSRWRPILQWLPVENTMRERQQDYYAALAVSDAEGSCEAFVEFMLEAIADSLKPYASPDSPHAARKNTVIEYLSAHDNATIGSMAADLGYSKRTAERLVAELKREGLIYRKGSTRSGRWFVS